MFNKHSRLFKVLAIILPMCMLLGIIMSVIMKLLPVVIIAVVLLAVIGFAGRRISEKRR